MMPWHGWWGMWGGGWVGIILLLLFWAVVIGLAVWAIRALVRSNRPPAGPSGGDRWGHETPLDILNRRYANGEISREEYLNIRQDLES